MKVDPTKEEAIEAFMEMIKKQRIDLKGEELSADREESIRTEVSAIFYKDYIKELADGK